MVCEDDESVRVCTCMHAGDVLPLLALPTSLPPPPANLAADGAGDGVAVVNVCVGGGGHDGRRSCGGRGGTKGQRRDIRGRRRTLQP